MKPEEALDVLDRTVAQINGSRQVHVQLQQAVECLRTFILDQDGKSDTKQREHQKKT